MRKTTFVLTLAMLVLAGTIFAQERNPYWGTSKAPCMAGVQVEPVRANLGKIHPATGVIPGRDTDDTSPSALIFPSSYYAAGGAGLRNRTTATINITGLNGGQNAYFGVLYWAVITEFSGTGLVPFYSVTLTNEQNSLSAPLSGILVGQGPSPCWPGTTINVFRALFDASSKGPFGVVTSGRYTVTVAPGSLTNGQDPWVGTPEPPLWEGVSLILVASAAGTSDSVVFYDTGIAGTSWGGLFGPATTYTLALPSTAPHSTTFNYTTMGADGQVGSSTTAEFPDVVAEQVFFNGKQISGIPTSKVAVPPNEDPDSDWNGAIAGPLPQLWDTSTHTILPPTLVPTSEVVVDDANALGDCLTVVANVLGIGTPYVVPLK